MFKRDSAETQGYKMSTQQITVYRGDSAAYLSADDFIRRQQWLARTLKLWLKYVAD